MNWLAGAVVIACLGITSAAQAVDIASTKAQRWAGGGLVLVQGNGLNKASLTWDGAPLKTAYLEGARALTFTIPRNASGGTHLLQTVGDGAPVSRNVSVVHDTINLAPRLDHVTLAGSRFDGAGNVNATLYVQGANIDVGARLLVDDQPVPSTVHKVLLNELYGADPQVLHYPIWHYLARIAPLPPMPRGRQIRIAVVNENGTLSNAVDYRLPTDPNSLDSDGDGLPDVIEINGWDSDKNGKADEPPKVLGLDPFVRNVLVEVDVMAGIAYPPSAEALRLAQQAFASAPILNPFNESGVRLFLDVSGQVPFWNAISFRESHEPLIKLGSVDRLAEVHFTRSRKGWFHYAIWGNAHAAGWSGESNVDFDGTGVGDTFVVTLSEFPPAYQVAVVQASTLLHELGHNLGQRHGGTDHLPHKSTYWSVMSYSWQLRSGWPATSRKQYPTCTQVFYGKSGAIETLGSPAPGLVQRLDYSEGMGPELMAASGLQEGAGVCGQPIDWDGDGSISGSPVNAQLTPDDPDVISIADYPNWASLRYDGPRIGGQK